jgi:thioredoxin-related protein
MKKFALPMMALIASVAPAHAASITWSTAFASATMKAKMSHKLLMVDFYTSWCGWCKTLDKNTYSSSEVIAKANNFVPVKLDAEKGGLAEATKYKVRAFPTILFLKPTGEVVWKIEGYMPPADFEKQMDLASGSETELPKLEATFKKTGGNPALDSKLIAYYGGTNQIDKIKPVVESLEKFETSAPSAELGDAYNAGGDAFQNAQQFPQAIAYFRKAEMDGKPTQVAYARISLAECYLAGNDVTSAAPVLKALVKMGPEADAYRTQAQQILDQIDKKAAAKS